MPFIAVLRILARFKDARCADAAHRLSWRRASLTQTGQPGRSNRSDRRLVRQVFEKIERGHQINRIKRHEQKAIKSAKFSLCCFPLVPTFGGPVTADL